MAVREATGWCAYCREQRLIRQQAPAHLLHAFITLFTLGLWVFIWIWAASTYRPYRCTVCGATAFPDTFEEDYAEAAD